MPVPRAALPLIVDAPQPAPCGPAMFSRLSPSAIWRRLAVRELGEDAPDYGGLDSVDLPPAMDRLSAGVVLSDDLIAIAQPAARSTLAHSALKPPVGLGREVFDEQGTHCALQPDMQLVDLAVGKSHEFDAGEGQMFEQRSHVLLVARKPIEPFGNYNVEDAVAGILQEPLVIRPEAAGAAHGGVAVGANEMPALPIDPLPANPDLFLDRGAVLKIGRISCVNCGTHQPELPHLTAHSPHEGEFTTATDVH
jgi:hypothetical protein